MCLICIEFDKLSNIEAERNLGEMRSSLGEHADVVEMKIVGRKLRQKWEKTGLLKGLEGMTNADIARIVPLSKPLAELLRQTMKEDGVYES